jgi:hypothetical protein
MAPDLTKYLKYAKLSMKTLSLLIRLSTLPDESLKFIETKHCGKSSLTMPMSSLKEIFRQKKLLSISEHC